MVEGLSTYVVNSFEQIERLIAQGNGLRTTAATQMNEESSRSHGRVKNGQNKLIIYLILKGFHN